MRKYMQEEIIEKFYKELKWIKDLYPNKQSNKIFRELVDYCTKNNIDIKYNRKVGEINKICARWEYKLKEYNGSVAFWF